MEKELPKNWVETELGNIINLMNGYAFKSNDYSNEGIPIIRMSDIENNEINIEKAVRVPEKKEYNKFTINIGDILIGMSGSIGKYGIFSLSEKVYLNQRVGNLRLISENHTNKKLIYYFIGQFQKEIVDKAYGGAVPNISGKQIEECIFPLPPLHEQNRIVAKLDTLFAQLETIKKSMANVPLLLKDFRQQILTQAVTGKLTEEWRKGKKLKEWEEQILLDVIIEKPRNGFSPKSVDYITPVKSLTLSATTSGKFNPSNIKYLDIEIPKKDSHLWLKNGDILIQRSNSLDYVGTSAIYDGEDYDFIYPDIMMKIKNNNSILNIFLMYVLTSQNTRKYFRDNASGTAGNMPKINQDIVSNTPILLPSIQEQQEIVTRVESLFAKADAIEKHYEILKAKIDSLPQAILHKAFKGELTEQLESDGDARELLREIEMLKQVQHDKGKTKKSATKKVNSYVESDEVLGMVAEVEEELITKVVKLKPTNAEIYKRTLLAAEIVYQLKETNTLGHLKLQKMLYLCQEIGSMNLPMNFLKQAMGPYDNQLARSLDKQFVEKKWFEYQRDELLKYKPLQNCGKHKEDYQKYFETEVEQINYLITKFKKFTSNQIEAVATLYACWKEAIGNKELITDKLITTKFYQWSKEKEKFREEKLVKALEWMRMNGIYPN